MKVGAADARAAAVLDLRRGAKIVRIERVRSLKGEVCIVERIVLPNALFPRIEKRELPNNLYELYRAQFGVTIARATERLKAVAAGKARGAASRRRGRRAALVDRPHRARHRRARRWNGACRCAAPTAVHYLSDLA